MNRSNIHRITSIDNSHETYRLFICFRRKNLIFNKFISRYNFRDDFDKPLLKSDVLKIEDLKVGMELSGTVRNVVDFGAFIDIGLHDDGLIHVSKLSHDFVKDPLDIVKVGDIVDCYVVDVDLEKNRVFLSLIKYNRSYNRSRMTAGCQFEVFCSTCRITAV